MATVQIFPTKKDLELIIILENIKNEIIDPSLMWVEINLFVDNKNFIAINDPEGENQNCYINGLNELIVVLPNGTFGPGNLFYNLTTRTENEHFPDGYKNEVTIDKFALIKFVDKYIPECGFSEYNNIVARINTGKSPYINKTTNTWIEFNDLQQKYIDTGIPVTGPKGDPFTYEDFTPDQIAELQKPATDAATQVLKTEAEIKLAEQARVQAEQTRVQSEQQRETAEQQRVELFSEIVVNAGEVIEAASTAAGSANDAASSANTAAGNANAEAGAANTAAGNATEAASAANTAAGNATDAADAANTAADAANEAASAAQEVVDEADLSTILRKTAQVLTPEEQDIVLSNIDAQKRLEAGENITIEGNVISSVNSPDEFDMNFKRNIVEMFNINLINMLISEDDWRAATLQNNGMIYYGDREWEFRDIYNALLEMSTVLFTTTNTLRVCSSRTNLKIQPRIASASVAHSTCFGTTWKIVVFPSTYLGKVTSINYMFGNSQLEKVIGEIDMQYVLNHATQANIFYLATKLTSIRLKNLQYNLIGNYLNSIDNDSIYYMMNESKIDADITFSFPQVTFDRAIQDSRITDLLTSRPNIKLIAL